MGRMYSARASSTQATAGDIISIQAPSTGMAILHTVAVTQASSETDDSTEIRISRFATVGSGGSVITPSGTQVGHAASAIIVRAFDTTDASGTETEIYSEGISLLAGFQKIWTPSARPMIPPSGRIVIKFIGDITSVTMHVAIEFEELD